MGILIDYFRAPNAATAVRVKDRLGYPLAPGAAGFDCVEAKGIEPAVKLAKLVASILRVPWDPELVTTDTAWPPPETRPASLEEYNDLPDDTPWKEGPFVEELGVQVRDALAAVDDARLPGLAAEWAQIEEFRGYETAEDLLPLIRDLAALAKRARAADEQLYCWSCD